MNPFDVKDNWLRFWLIIAAIGAFCLIAWLPVALLGAIIYTIIHIPDIFTVSMKGAEWSEWWGSFCGNLLILGSLVVIGAFGFVKRLIRVKWGVWVHGAVFIAIPILGILMRIFAFKGTSSLSWILTHLDVLLLSVGSLVTCVIIFVIAGETGNPLLLCLIFVVFLFVYVPYCALIGLSWANKFLEDTLFSTRTPFLLEFFHSAKEWSNSLLAGILGLSVLSPRGEKE